MIPPIGTVSIGSVCEDEKLASIGIVFGTNSEIKISKYESLNFFIEHSVKFPINKPDILLNTPHALR